MLISFYLFGAVTTFTVGLRAFLRDRSTPKSHAISWIVLFEATFFWPLVLPIAYLERRIIKV
ncbi:MAG: hypothetical protein SWJ54_15955 [Cyanobacteriota bacterium]|nr:hypothetical protein [Cyanobacteriota bacterium]